MSRRIAILGAEAYSLNVTVVPADTLGYLTLWDSQASMPVASTLNSLEGAVVSNAALVLASSNGAIDVFASDLTDTESVASRSGVPPLDQPPAFMEQYSKQAVLVRKIPGSEFSFLANAYATHEQYARALGCKRNDPGAHCRAGAIAYASDNEARDEFINGSEIAHLAVPETLVD
ncbi:MAG: hypothetical protein JO138_26900 [Acidobacteriaceae bacterium]|nr:hypothetical protein [Acidobacteriaceae bacterium]